MKSKKVKLIDFKVKSFITNLEEERMNTVVGGAEQETTPDPTPITTTDEPIKVPATGLFCPTGGMNWC
jgi:hypothetical protein